MRTLAILLTVACSAAPTPKPTTPASADPELAAAIDAFMAPYLAFRPSATAKRRCL